MLTVMNINCKLFTNVRYKKHEKSTPKPGNKNCLNASEEEGCGLGSGLFFAAEDSACFNVTFSSAAVCFYNM